jgi:hypothetical protein
LDLSYLSLANNQLTGTIPNTWGTIGLAYNQLRGSLKPLGNMRALKVDFLRNNTPGFQFSGTCARTAEKIGALYLDGNPGLTSLDLPSCQSSSPNSGWGSGCEFDYPEAQAVGACCLTGDNWTSAVKASPYLSNCFNQTLAPHTYDCVITGDSGNYSCVQDAAFGTGPFVSEAACKAQCEATTAKCTGKSSYLPEIECHFWQQLYDSTGGKNWENCNSARTDPCNCSWSRDGNSRGINAHANDTSQSCDHIYSIDLSRNIIYTARFRRLLRI